MAKECQVSWNATISCLLIVTHFQWGHTHKKKHSLMVVLTVPIASVWIVNRWLYWCCDVLDLAIIVAWNWARFCDRFFLHKFISFSSEIMKHSVCQFGKKYSPRFQHFDLVLELQTMNLVIQFVSMKHNEPQSEIIQWKLFEQVETLPWWTETAWEMDGKKAIEAKPELCIAG